MIKTTYLSGGCFWGMEELFRNLKGITDTKVGYCGGSNTNPTYQFHPGHAECLELKYDSSLISFKEILDFFFRIHDPTTLNRQGNDVGSSYRSAIFYQNDEELKISKEVIIKVDKSKLYKNKVTTTLEKFEKFYLAEKYHQDYLQKNPAGYTCHFLRTNNSII